MHPDLILNATCSIPLRWVDEIFRRLSGRFGAQFTEKFRSGVLVDHGGNLISLGGDMSSAVDAGIEAAKQVWAEELDFAGITPDQIKRGLQERYQYPPSCDEFIRGCQGGGGVGRDPETLFYRAQAEMGNRRARKAQNWPNRPLFWAAAAMGQELLKHDYRNQAGRWRAMLDANAGNEQAIPDVSDENALPAPTAELSRQDAEKRLQKLGGTVKSMSSGNASGIAWARRIAVEVAEGRSSTNGYGRKLAAEAFIGLHLEVPDSLSGYLSKA
ncbi:hypothetical protein KIF53_09500 [Chromobacterium subtsugae]|uniref:Primase C-terminal 2 domain-containing protein n=1 Tax=Chromobacterium subtsugae TaxID=251747 RepID=A0ABS7FCN0_9NEIS|nr:MULTISPECIES: hypothetical protein [Chromobacterium]KUM04234.1 hypothetical protein Cv017_15900 [Chromobacterium subtsugae]MBW7566283.1 hypothetical protein [Chromobacterium subtsugae]MBW8287858.1 hypothetical protein [Chromobacterium subtsugae]WSE91187.1 hypothetical protein U6115_20285 [Chromobacterium subtsugae]WVH59562.1 hypothetical protein U6151_20315 [Chromobacterium subtsugae]